MRILAATVILFVAGCNSSLDRPIHFMVPDGFSGPFVIVSNPDYPDVIVKRQERYELVVPRDGVIRTKSTRIFERWHKTSASYESRKPFPPYDSPDSLLHEGPCQTYAASSYIEWFYVGENEKFHAFMYDDLYGRKASQWLSEHGLK
jgi:hypothetical protein